MPVIQSAVAADSDSGSVVTTDRSERVDDEPESDNEHSGSDTTTEPDHE